MEHQITEEDKKMAREIKRVLKIDDNYVLAEMGQKDLLVSELEKRGRKDLADFLRRFKQEQGMEISDILPEIEVDDNFEEELKTMRGYLNE